MNTFIKFLTLILICNLTASASDVYIYTPNLDAKSVVFKSVQTEGTGISFTKTAIQLEQGKFKITLTETEPVYVFLIINDSLYTNAFFLDSMSPLVEITITPDLNFFIEGSNSQIEFVKAYRPTLEVIDKELSNFFRTTYRDSYIKHNGQLPDTVALRFDSIRTTIRQKRFQEMYNYIVTNPDSYVAMWLLVEEIKAYGYVEKLAESYTRFSNKLKQSQIGEMVLRLLNDVYTLAPGNKFPNLILKDTLLQEIDLKSVYQGQFILVDFWFSSCLPCIEQFPVIKQLYNAYSRDQLSILFVSIDRAIDLNKWKEAIRKYQLNFPQFLDVDGTIARSKLHLIRYPSNFLLDGNGKILQKDISPAKLKEFLEINLKKSGTN